ncbi:MAG TPA: ABC transporter substrate-binding protein [Saprospiraceae bacterium]|nr:hypothetical protein [Saprospiraceae bacterium]HRO08911.1 ABC transporter substrate-binding protein [Saprospiraceae bacterium]HRP42343.1 ABC transporter substrate-binding protein [Saprospiraceae bacterium]
MSVSKYLLISVFLIGLVSCKNSTDTPESILHIRLKKDPDRLNPLLFPNPVAREVYQYIYVPLADYNPASLQLEPVLIQQMPEEIAIDTGIYKGGIAFDIEFREDARWDNGSPVTANDYIFTLKAINLPMTDAGKYRSFTENITDIIPDPSDTRKCRVIFDKDYMLALETCTNLELYPQYFFDSLNILGAYPYNKFTDKNKKQLQEDKTLQGFAESFNSTVYSRDKISGAGPYRFVSWTADQNIVLEKKPDYWAKKTSISNLEQGPDKIIFHVIVDEITALAQLKSGNIDVMNEVSSDAYNDLENDPVMKQKLQFFHPSLTKQYYILINNDDEILKDIHVRKALAHLIDTDNIINKFEHGKAVRTTGPVHPLKATNNSSLKPVAFDIEMAKNLLVSSGWSDSDRDGILDKMVQGKKQNLEIEILITGQELGKNIALLLQENARKAGIAIKITEKDMKLIRSEHVRTRKYQLIPSILSQDVQIWDDLSRWNSANNTPDGANDIAYKNAETDQLIDKIPSTKNANERIELYKKIQQLIYDDQACIFLYAPEERIIISGKWKASATSKRPGYMANTFQYTGSTVPNQ